MLFVSDSGVVRCVPADIHAQWYDNEAIIESRALLGILGDGNDNVERLLVSLDKHMLFDWIMNE